MLPTVPAKFHLKIKSQPCLSWKVSSCSSFHYTCNGSCKLALHACSSQAFLNCLTILSHCNLFSCVRYIQCLCLLNSEFWIMSFVKSFVWTLKAFIQAKITKFPKSNMKRYNRNQCIMQWLQQNIHLIIIMNLSQTFVCLSESNNQ